MNELDKANDQIERIWRFLFILVVINGIIGTISAYKLEADILNLKNKVKHLVESINATNN
jgi:hypothetical protein